MACITLGQVELLGIGQDAAARRIPVEQVLGEFREVRWRIIYVRLKADFKSELPRSSI